MFGRHWRPIPPLRRPAARHDALKVSFVMPKDAPTRNLRLPERWDRSIAAGALTVLGVCFCALASADPRPPAHVAETYTSEYEKAPNPDFVVRETTAEWARAEQDRFRLRVAIPDAAISEEESSSEVQA